MDGSELPPNVPDEVRDVWIHFGGVTVPDVPDKAERAIYMRAAGEYNDAGETLKEPCCMMCGGALGEETVVIVTAVGISQIYCTHTCNQDMMILGYLSQAYDDRKEAMELRGSLGRGNG